MESQLEMVSLLLLWLVSLVSCQGAKNFDWHAAYDFPSSTPFPDSMKCWTCVDGADDNYNCNRWAPDVWCPEGTRYCHTVHHMNEVGQSIKVWKKCAALDECSRENVGCSNTDIPGVKKCVSCCEGHICNYDVPTNETNAVFDRQTASSASYLRSTELLLVTVALSIVLRIL
ncbi:PREDICTED: ly6/PLAUR domain-containing protein 6B-like [Branchiostoma belcheri]|uniref:Ly6/PLAUR domain-containing protein 6B-like n=1 Tax=Branchiostoma belcheri TaxID=7741 RepID=A0A6P5AVG0_BRABE|nr:PREDICTED: ly6/PLAUR domain-containing protein 6B-like [Branchiostoma belcheri]XP_019645962.1 PREDICTED: ly6/PLAUR domain-containing protein 6B-like [Branchiostoma belcheri]XP_019645963.1 PREDICTED: ly6/PLAUR domain-containing protein 6B-like [Branchiostoma belcheri]XP_019645964.1 PREDICTED: ly6/PLAUR domain-containing protein 6B-like [Branchiostoma belcheri]XP_019645965.1 PREDICTED: ly6/PLAUR domain-containing protein 6B-like [Branchiostoma belcheri]